MILLIKDYPGYTGRPKKVREVLNLLHENKKLQQVIYLAQQTTDTNLELAEEVGKLRAALSQALDALIMAWGPSDSPWEIAQEKGNEAIEAINKILKDGESIGKTDLVFN